MSLEAGSAETEIHVEQAVHPSISVFDSVLAGRLGSIAEFSYFGPLFDARGAITQPLLPNSINADSRPRELEPAMSGSDKLADLVRTARLGRFTILQNGLQHGAEGNDEQDRESREPGVARLFLIKPVDVVGLEAPAAEVLRAIYAEVVDRPNVVLHMISQVTINNLRNDAAHRYTSFVQTADTGTSLMFYDDARRISTPGTSEYERYKTWHDQLSSLKGVTDQDASMQYVLDLADRINSKPAVVK